MKLVKTASGKKTIKMSKTEWTEIGKTSGWMKEAQFDDEEGEKGDSYSAAGRQCFSKIKQIMPRLEEQIRIGGQGVEELEEIGEAIATWKRQYEDVGKGISFYTDDDGVASDVV